MYVILVFLVVGLLVLLFLNVMANKELAEQRKAEIAASVLPAATPQPVVDLQPTPTPARNTEEILLTFAGDVVGQMGLNSQARYELESDSDSEEEAEPEYDYDYTEQLAQVAASLADADFASCNLASVLKDAAEYDSYHMPEVFAETLADVGFDLVNTASEHALGLGQEGLNSTVAAIENAGMVNLGTAADKSRFDENGGIYTKVINGVTFAFMSYAAGTNGQSAADYPYAVNILTTDYMSGQSAVDYDRLSRDLTLARDMGADIIVCYLYWWTDANYYTDVREDQGAVTDFLCRSGADIIIGGGVKVPQPIELRKVEREPGVYTDCVVAYSLGSLVSCMNDNYTNLSAVLDVTLLRDVDNGEVWISQVSYRPMFMMDTDDHGDVVDAGYKYRLYDLYHTMDRYEAVNEGAQDADPESLAADCITYGVYHSMQDGAAALQNILGAEFDEVNGGVDVPAWSATVQMR